MNQYVKAPSTLDIRDANAFTVVGSPVGDSHWDNVELLIQAHEGDASDASALVDRGPSARVATISSGSVTVNDSGGAPWGAVVTPNSAVVTYSNDAGLIPATGGSFTLEFVGNREHPSYFDRDGPFGAGGSGVNHMKPYFDDSTNLLYTNGGTADFGAFDPGPCYVVAGGKPPENYTIQVEDDDCTLWVNGHRVSKITGAAWGASYDWSTDWDTFALFADRVTSPSAYFAGKMIAFRYTSLARYDSSGDIAIPLFFPEWSA